MNPVRVDWQAGEPAVFRAVGAWLEDPSTRPTETLAQSPRRILHRVELEPESGREDESGTACVVKRHRTATGRHPWREAFKRRLGVSSARREWRALERLHAAGQPVPRPLAWGRLADGDEIVVTRWRSGMSLDRALVGASPERRRELISALADAIERLHGAGFRHGDLHAGNILIEPPAVTFLDLQRAHRSTRARSRLEDIARLELSLVRRGLSDGECWSLQGRLGVRNALDPVLRRFARDHVRGRSRRRLRVGRDLARVRFEDESGARLAGLCDASLAPATIRAWIERFESSPASAMRRSGRVRILSIRDGERLWVVKRTEAGSLGRALADRVRGSGAARAFATGRRLRMLGALAPEPWAFVEQRRHGLPRRSWLVMEAVGEADLDRFQPRSKARAIECGRALGAWLAERHAWGLGHRDLKASNLRIAPTQDGFRFWWVDLEDVELRAPDRVSDRLRALAQLNASLDDEAFPIEARHAALDAYRERLPFDAKLARIRSQIASQSLARDHRWRGEGCVEVGAGAPRAPGSGAVRD